MLQTFHGERMLGVQSPLPLPLPALSGAGRSWPGPPAQRAASAPPGRSCGSRPAAGGWPPSCGLCANTGGVVRRSIPYFLDYKALEIISFSQKSIRINSGCADCPRSDFMCYLALKSLLKCFSTTWVNYEAAPLEWLSEFYTYRNQVLCVCV